MRKTVYSILLYILVFSFTMSFFNGVSLPVDPIYWVATAITFAAVVMLHRPVLRFLTVKINFVTFLLSASLLSIGAFYILELFMPEFMVEASTFSGFNAGTVTVSAFEFTRLTTIIVSSLVFAALCALMESLKGSDE